MPTTVSHARDLELARLAELLYVERRLAAAVLPELIEQARHEALREALRDHLEQTRGHADRLERVFELLEAESAAALSEPFQALVAEHERRSARIGQRALADCFHASAAVATEHLEIGAYTSLLSLARAESREEAASLLEANLKEEKQALTKLERLLDGLARDAAALDAAKRD